MRELDYRSVLQEDIPGFSFFQFIALFAFSSIPALGREKEAWRRDPNGIPSTARSTPWYSWRACSGPSHGGRSNSTSSSSRAAACAGVATRRPNSELDKDELGSDVSYYSIIDVENAGRHQGNARGQGIRRAGWVPQHLGLR